MPFGEPASLCGAEHSGPGDILQPGSQKIKQGDAYEVSVRYTSVRHPWSVNRALLLFAVGGALDIVPTSVFSVFRVKHSPYATLVRGS